jgi:hypothetical protein
MITVIIISLVKMQVLLLFLNVALFFKKKYFRE